MIRRLVENPRQRALAVVATMALLCMMAAVSQAQTCEDYGQYLKWVGNCSLPGTGSPYNGECVDVHGDFAYVGENGSMCVVDISDPTAPYVRGTLSLAGWVLDMEVQYPYAYMTIDGAGLQIVDISNPDAPAAAGSAYSSTSGLLEVDGIYVYLVKYMPARGQNVLIVYNVFDPYAPAQIYWNYIPGFTVQSLKKQGNFLYFGAKGEFIVMDVSSPSSPLLERQCSVDDPVSGLSGLAVDGAYVYVNKGGRLMAYDLSGGGAVAADSIQITKEPADEMQTDGNLLVISSAEGLTVVDVNDPLNLRRTGSIEVVGNTRNNGVALAGNYAYVTSADAGFHVVDLFSGQSPDSPTHHGRFDTYDAQDVMVVGDLAYVADRVDGLVIVNVADPTAPFAVGSQVLADAMGVDVRGDYAYVVTGGASQGYLKVFDVSTPSAPSEIASHQFVGHEAHDIVVQNGYAYIVAGWRCYVVDISIPAAPNVVQTLTTSMTYPKSVALGPGYALYGFAEGFVMVDINDPPNAYVAGTWSAPPSLGNIGAVGTDGTDAFVSHLLGFTAVDISTPAALSLMSTLPLPETAGIFTSDVVVIGDDAFVAMATAGIYMVDVTDPNNMEFTGAVDPLGVDWGNPGLAGGLWVAQDVAYIADGLSGLQIVASHCCDWPVLGVDSGRERPVNPALLGSAPNPFAQSTTIWFAPAAEGPLRIEVFDVTGRLVDVLVDDVVPAGLQSVTWRGVDSHGRAVPSGTYFYRLTEDGRTATKKLLLLK